MIKEPKPKQYTITTYSADGFVEGLLWGGGFGWYTSRNYFGYNSLPKLKKDIKGDFKCGALDGGMGYEKLTAASMNITKTDIKSDWVRTKVTKFRLGTPKTLLGTD